MKPVRLVLECGHSQVRNSKYDLSELPTVWCEKCCVAAEIVTTGDL